MASERQMSVLRVMGMDTEQAEKVRDVQRNVMDAYVRLLETERRIKIDELVRVSLQPKPKYLHEWLWKKLIGRIVRLEILKSVTHGD